MLSKEPIAVTSAIAELARQVLLTLVIFEVVNWTQAQQTQLLMLVSGALTAATIFIARQQSVPIVVADKQMEIAKASDVSRPTSEIIRQAKKETQ